MNPPWVDMKSAVTGHCRQVEGRREGYAPTVYPFAWFFINRARKEKFMKKFVSYVILFSMIVSMLALIPMTVSAAGTVHTSEYFDSNSKTGLDAYYGTPAIATWLKNSQSKAFGAINTDNTRPATLKDATWDNAYKFTANSTTNSQFGGTVYSKSDYDIWILWDNDNLYILQDTRGLYTLPSGGTDWTLAQMKTSTTDLGAWGDLGRTIQVEHSYYQILLPRQMDNLGDASKRPKAFAIGAIPCLSDAAVASYKIYEGVARVRDFEYASNSGSGTNQGMTVDKTMLTWSSTSGSGASGTGTFDKGVRTFVERLTVEGGKTTQYRTATIIPWTELDSTPEDTFAKLPALDNGNGSSGKEAKVGKTIGISIWNIWTKHINDSGMVVGDIPANNDTAGFDSVTLLSPGAVKSTTELFDETSMTGLDAYQADGTIDMSMTSGSIINPLWAEKGVKFTLNADTKACYPNAGGSGDSDYYLLWVSEYIYILEIHRNLTIKGNNLSDGEGGAQNAATKVEGWTSAWTCTTFNFLMPEEMVYADYHTMQRAGGPGYDSENNKFITGDATVSSHVISVPGVKETDPEGTIAKGVVRVRDAIYCHDLNGVKCQYKAYRPYMEKTGFEVISQRTADGYAAITRINVWNICGKGGEALLNKMRSGQAAGQTLGLKIYPPGSGGYHINNTIYSNKPNEETEDPDDVLEIKINQDYSEFDPITLLAKKPTVANTGVKPAKITPDTDYWIGPNGLFTHPDTRDSVVYDINNAEQLLGLSHVLESASTKIGSPLYEVIGGTSQYTALPQAPKRTDEMTDEEYNALYAEYEQLYVEVSNQLYHDRRLKYKLTKGKVFRLTADIDLNPGIVWENYQSYVCYNTVVPTNVFMSLDSFYGTFDGQGHKISGLFAPLANNGSNSQTADFGGLIGSLRSGGVKNLFIDNGYVCDYNAGGFGGVIGTVYPTDYTDDYALMEIENITVGQNYHVVSAYKVGGGQTGGIIGSNWSYLTQGDVNVTVVINDVTYLGHIHPGATPNATFGYFIGGWNYYRASDNKSPENTEYDVAYFYLEMTDCAAFVQGTAAQLNSTSRWTLTKTDAVKDATLTRCLETSAGVAMPNGWATKWTDTTLGPLPTDVAYSIEPIKWQATDVRDRAYTDNKGVSHNAGTYDVRVVSTVYSLDWAYAGFKATVYNLTDGTSYLVHNVQNKKVHETILAAGKEIDSGSVGIIKGAQAYMYYILIEDLDPGKNYVIEVRTVLTRQDGTAVESSLAKTFTPVPYNLKAAAEAIKPDILQLEITGVGDIGAKNAAVAGKPDMEKHSADKVPTVSYNADFGRNEAIFSKANNTAWEYKLSQADWDKITGSATGATMEMFIWFDSMANDDRPFSNQQTGGMGFNTRTTSGTGLCFTAVQHGNGTLYQDPTAPVALKKYLHIVGVFDKVSNTTTLYIDGVAVASEENVYQLGSPEKAEDYYMVVGGDSGGSGDTTNNFNGKMISANVYSRALSQEEIRLLYANYYYN